MSKRPTHLAELACLQKQERMTQILSGTSTKPDKAAPVMPSPTPYPAGAAVNSAAWFLLDLGLDDETARRIEESW